jgi:hypothetical protein
MRDENINQRTAALAALVAFSVTAVVYGRGLALPFQSDDLLQVPWVASARLSELWTATSPYNDYRPLHFTLWWLTQFITGTTSPMLLHALNLIVHAVCGTLVGVVLKALWDETAGWAIVLATAGFTLFPFAYDNVLWISSLGYLLTMALTLSALLCYLTARRQAQPRWHLLGLPLTILAGFGYEAGVVAGPAVVWIGLTFTDATLADVRRHRWLWAYGASSLLPLLAVLRFSPEVPTRFLQGVHPQYNPLAALQAVVFPIAPLAQRFGAPITGLLLLGLAVLAGLGFMAWRGHWLSRCVGALGWVVLWSLIPLMTQAFNWFRDPPRVFYPAAVGTALLWTNVIQEVVKRLPSTTAQTAAALGLGALLLIPGGRFLVDEVRFYRIAGDLIWQTIHASRSDEKALVVNLPDRLTRQPQTYPLGHEGVIPLPPPTDGDVLLAAHGLPAAQVTLRGRGDLLPTVPYRIDPVVPPVTYEDVRAADRVLLAAYGDDSGALLPVGRVLTATTAAVPQATFGEALHLLTVECRKDADTVILDVTWRSDARIEGQPTLFTHWLDTGGALVAQADGDPLGGLYPLNAWRAGDVVHEERRVAAATGEGHVGLGVWDPIAGTRWPAVDAAGQPLPDQTYRLACSPQAVTP